MTTAEQDKIAKLEQQYKIASGAVRQAALLQKRYRDALSLLKKKDTELKDSLKEMKEMQFHLIEKEKMAALGGLVAGVAHEVNTPLSVAITSNSVVMDECKRLKAKYEAGELTEEIFKDFFETFEESNRVEMHSLQRAAKLIRSFKRISVDQMSDDKLVINLYEYLQDVILTFHTYFKQTQIKTVLDCPKNLVVETCPGPLAQIFSNLLENTLKYAFGDDKNGNINIRIEPQQEKLYIVFADDGIGMSEDLRQHVFEPFVTTHRQEGSSGLGLNIVFNLITQRFNGNIHLESEHGKGSRFIFEITVGFSELL
ncbi:MAG: HAMP domain-containing histidine kinase [Proteobacteria bacterium]|nr:HAMP domain-containing histidine kinase [Pseudomonadota bacterium]